MRCTAGAGGGPSGCRLPSGSLLGAGPCARARPLGVRLAPSPASVLIAQGDSGAGPAPGTDVVLRTTKSTRWGSVRFPRLRQPGGRGRRPGPRRPSGIPRRPGGHAPGAKRRGVHVGPVGRPSGPGAADARGYRTPTPPPPHTTPVTPVTPVTPTARTHGTQCGHSPRGGHHHTVHTDHTGHTDTPSNSGHRGPATASPAHHPPPRPRPDQKCRPDRPTSLPPWRVKERGRGAG